MTDYFSKISMLTAHSKLVSDPIKGALSEVFGILGRRAIYIQGAVGHLKLF